MSMHANHDQMSMGAKIYSVFSLPWRLGRISLDSLTFPLAWSLSTRTIPKAVLGVSTPPCWPSGGRAVFFGGGSATDRAHSAMRSDGQHPKTTRQCKGLTAGVEVSWVSLALEDGLDLD